jgi:hypothetical protein
MFISFSLFGEKRTAFFRINFILRYRMKAVPTSTGYFGIQDEGCPYVNRLF